MAPSPIDVPLIHRLRRLFDPVLRYHRFTAHGLEHVPRTGPALLVVHHTLATYDGVLIAGAIWDAIGRIPRGLGDDRIFQTPVLGSLAARVGIVPASPDAGEALLRAREIVAVAPGGMWESLRPRTERRRGRWEGRKGFVRLALRTGAPMILAACPAADDLYTVYPNPVTDRLYQRFHLPVPVARGIGPTLLPRRVRLTAWIAPPIVPPPWDPAREAAQIDALHETASAAMRDLLTRE